MQTDYSKHPKVYIAGPDVFRPDLATRTAALKALCLEYGLLALIPAENLEIKEAGEAAANHIFTYNVELIRQADAILADFSPWRGISLDAGTSWELGMGYALRLPMAGYGPQDEYKKRFTAPLILDSHGLLKDSDNTLVEDFGLPDNVMPIKSLTAGYYATAADAIKNLARVINAR